MFEISVVCENHGYFEYFIWNKGVKNRLNLWNAHSYSAHTNFPSSMPSKNTNFKILPLLLYGCKTWFAAWGENIFFVVYIIPLCMYSRDKLQHLPSTITPLFYLTLLHVSAVLTGRHHALCTSYNTYTYTCI